MTCRYLCAAVLIAVALLPRISLAEVPTFESVVGHAIGERITETRQIQRYLEALATHSDRVAIEHLGSSWQGRPLMHAIVTAPENHARLDDIQSRAQQLGDPRNIREGELASLIADQPAVFWYGGSIHGFELSGTEAGLKMLERLTTANDSETLALLQNLIIIIDPVLNPDGRDAFAYHNHDRLGRQVNPDNSDWSNDFTRWEGLKYRTSHYFFDLNRDWFAHTHPETQARVPVFQSFPPQAAIDAHEMGANVEFYFDPPTDPIGPFFPDFTTRWFERFGMAHAQAFDAVGVDYMTRERYNFFYPAFTTSYLSYQGAVGMLYEQGSSRGLALTRPDGTVRTLADATSNQYVAFEAALKLAARERETLLSDYVAGHRDAIADGAKGHRRYLLPVTGGDPQMVAEVVNLLRRSGVEVQRLTEPSSVRGLRDRRGATVTNRTFPAGTYVIEAAQPRNRFIRVLLEPEVPVPEDFLAQARLRVDRAENPRFYDITAWSLPLLYGIDGFSSTDGRALATEPVAAPVKVRSSDRLPEARYAYLIDGAQSAGLPALIQLRHLGYRVGMMSKPTRLGGRDYAAGTGIVYAGQAENGVHDDVRRVAERFDLDIHSVDSGLGEGRHPSLGSGEVIYLKAPKIAMLAEEPVHPYSFGWAWFTLDRQYELDVSMLRVGSLPSVDLAQYDSIILPELTDVAALERLAGDGGLKRLMQWVRDGGTLVTLGNATDVARQQELIKLRAYHDLEDNEHALKVAAPGAMVATRIDREHWLSAGVAEGFRALVNSDRVYLAPEGAPSPRIRPGIRYVAAEDFAFSGHLWQESIERLPDAVFAYEERVGQGRVIAFAEDLNFRAYYRAGNRLFLNAVLAGPSAP